jgi:hypothetical protein
LCCESNQFFDAKETCVVNRIKFVMQRKFVLWIESNLWFASVEISWFTHVMVK